MALVDRFLPAVAFAALLGREPQLRDIPYDTARADMDRLLDEPLTASSEDRPEEVQDALFAVCTFVDEAVLASDWPGRKDWLKRPLQRVRFGTANAGEEFYVRLASLCERAGDALPLPEELSGEPQDAAGRSRLREVLEVYAACLTLGFTGRYYDEKGRATLAAITRTSLKRLLGGAQAQGRQRDAHVFPETYAEQPRAFRRPRWRSAMGLLVLFGLPLLAAVLIHAAYASLLADALQGWLKALS